MSPLAKTHPSPGSHHLQLDHNPTGHRYATDISRNPPPRSLPDSTTKDDTSSPSKSKPAQESPGTSGFITPKTIIPKTIAPSISRWRSKLVKLVVKDPEVRKRMKAAGILGVWRRRSGRRRRGSGICLRLCPGGWNGGLTMGREVEGREVPSLMVRRSEWSRVWSVGLRIGACLRKGVGL